MLLSCVVSCCFYILIITCEKLQCMSVKDQIFIQSSHPFRQYSLTQLKGHRQYMQISPWLTKNPKAHLLVWVFLGMKLTVVPLCVWVFLWGGVSICLSFPFYKSTINFNRCGEVRLGSMLSPGNSNSLEVCAGHRFKQWRLYEGTGHKQQNRSLPD